MKRRNPPRRQIFVLTPEEKQAIACIVGAFVLGLATMQYRANHPRPAAALAKKEQSTKASRQSNKRTQGATRIARTTPTAPPETEDEE
jgi:hypothetical protein